MTLGDGNQAGYALVIAAFVTGICAWIAQKTKTKSENEKFELDFESSDRRNLIEGYREANKQLQERINNVYSQIDPLWKTISDMRTALEECEKKRIEDIKKIGEMQKEIEKAQRSRLEDTNKIIELERAMRQRGMLA